MTNSPCGCGHDHDEEKDAPTDGGHQCCGGGCCSDDDTDDSKPSTGGDACGCGHSHGHDHGHMPTISPEDMAQLKQAILDAGYQIEETADGEIRILEK